MNERFRFYKYDPSERFLPHYDGCIRLESGLKSHLTFMIYLNDVEEGGATRFYTPQGELRFSVAPATGKALVFLHLQLHEGAEVASGRKYVLRSDVMYRAPG